MVYLLTSTLAISHNVCDIVQVEGIGYDFIPRVLDRSVVDKVIKLNELHIVLLLFNCTLSCA